jgi:hypothetical protein
MGAGAGSGGEAEGVRDGARKVGVIAECVPARGGGWPTTGDVGDSSGGFNWPRRPESRIP